MKNILSHIGIGFIVAVTITVLGLAGIITYGFTHTPWTFFLSFGELKIVDFQSTTNGSFNMFFGGIGFIIFLLLFVLSYLLLAILLQKTLLPTTTPPENPPLIKQKMMQ